jgi:S-formylglutathione hydrolase FrmB
MVKHIGWPSLLLVAVLASPASAKLLPRPFVLDRYNRQIAGQVLDFTNNHGTDRRIYSPALDQKRDLYVYLPPGYDPCKRYPMGIYLHGFLSDEASFLINVVKPIDTAIACGKLPPMVIAAPDGSVNGLKCLATYGTFFSNTKLGRYEDYLVCDVYSWVIKTFSVRPEPEAHFLLGVSMGGHGAFSKTMKHPDKFRIALGILPPLNMLWSSCRERYMDKFDPCCWKQRDGLGRDREVVGRFYGIFTISQGHLINPMYGRNDPNTPEAMRRDNPFDLLDSRDVKPGQFEFFVAYAGKDEFNLDAQAESFLYRARQKDIPVTVRYLPDGHHNTATGVKFMPDIIQWLGEKLGRFAPE